MDPYQVVFDGRSDQDIVQYTLGGGVDRGSLVNFITGPLLVHPELADPSQILDIVEGLEYLHSQNVIHGRLRGVGSR